MARTLGDLAREMGQLSRELPQRANAVKQQAALAAADRLITDTPVDTSNAESNWQIGVGGPPIGPIPPHFLGEHGSTDQASQNEAKALARARILQAKPGEPVYISNEVPYIIKLDQGSSPQAPLGFTHLALALARSVIARLRLLRG